MQKFLTIILIQLAILTSLYAQDSKEVKSDLLRAIHKNNSNEVRAIASSQKDVIGADPILESMVRAYFLAEEKAFLELKEKARLQREEEARVLAEAIAAKEAEERRLVQEKDRQLLQAELDAKTAVVDSNKTSTLVQEIEKPTEPTVVKAKPVPKPQKVVAKSVPSKPKKVVRKASKSKVASKITYTPKSKKHPNKIHMSKVDIAGKWVAAKREKDITFKVFDDNTFKLEERNERGLLVLDGTYEYEGEELVLDIRKITYNVRSRDAAVQRIYHLEALSSKHLVLLDEKGEVAYSFRR